MDPAFKSLLMDMLETYVREQWGNAGWQHRDVWTSVVAVISPLVRRTLAVMWQYIVKTLNTEMIFLCPQGNLITDTSHGWLMAETPCGCTIIHHIVTLTLTIFSWVSIKTKGNYSFHTYLICYLEPLQQGHKFLLEVRLLYQTENIQFKQTKKTVKRK